MLAACAARIDNDSALKQVKKGILWEKPSLISAWTRRTRSRGNRSYTEAKKAAQRVLAALRRGEFSDPPGVDSDGLWLYRSIRGTSNPESLHQKLTKAFGHNRAGPEYSDNLLCHFRHRYNWRASERNRPFFPRVGHYNGLALDTINDLYEALFGMPKFPYWYQQGRFTTKSSLRNRAPSPQRECE
jgi:hypothetical protein